MAESPIRVYYADDPRLAHTLAGSLRKEIAEKSIQLTRGMAEDWADYKGRSEYIKGLQRAVDLAENIETELRGDRDVRRSA